MERHTPRRLADVLRHLPSQRLVNGILDPAVENKFDILRTEIARMEAELGDMGVPNTGNEV